MAELLKDLKFLWKEIRWAWEDFRHLRKREKYVARVPDKRIHHGNRVFCASTSAAWPQNINDILNEDGSPKPPWKEL